MRRERGRKKYQTSWGSECRNADFFLFFFLFFGCRCEMSKMCQLGKADSDARW